MPYQTNFPQFPRPGGTWWTVWQNLLWFANNYDAYVNKSQGGQATVLSGATTVAVTGIAVGPGYVVSLTPHGNPGGSYWISAVTLTGFTINVATAPTSNLTFDWTVKAP